MKDKGVETAIWKDSDLPQNSLDDNPELIPSAKSLQDRGLLNVFITKRDDEEHPFKRTVSLRVGNYGIEIPYSFKQLEELYAIPLQYIELAFLASAVEHACSKQKLPTLHVSVDQLVPLYEEIIEDDYKASRVLQLIRDAHMFITNILKDTKLSKAHFKMFRGYLSSMDRVYTYKYINTCMATPVILGQMPECIGMVMVGD